MRGVAKTPVICDFSSGEVASIACFQRKNQNSPLMARFGGPFLFGMAMPEKDINNLGLLSYVAMIAFAGWGASVSYMNKVRNGLRFKWRDLFIDIFCSAFAGVLAGLAGVAAELNLVAVFVMVGIAGHMGPKFISQLTERAFPRV